MATGPGCSKTKSGAHRKHTPIVSEKERALFGAVASGQKTKASGLTRAEAVRHLKESKGKKLPKRAKKRGWAANL